MRRRAAEWAALFLLVIAYLALAAPEPESDPVDLPAPPRALAT